jgi:FMN phosphatase YigB (HAD superfamily)
MIEVIVFDLGKVLVDFDYSIAARRLVGKEVTPEQMMRFVAESRLFIDYETGLITNEEFYQKVRALTGFTGGLDEFGECFGDIFTPIQPMIDLHATLRRRGFPTFIFSNTNDLAVRHIRQSFPFFSDFDGYILSYQHHAMKPNARLYEVVEEQTRRRGAQILYLDDRPENVEAGAARGWQVLLQQSPQKAVDAVRSLGLLA